MKFSRQLKRQFAKVAAATVMTVSVISPNGVSAFTYEPTANLSYREVSDKVDSVTDKYAPVYYKTSNYSESDPLYAATHFHIFAQDDVQLNAHTNGNIATNYMSFAGANSGTHGIETELNISEVSYVKDFKSINSQILWNGDSPLVVGPDVTVDTYDNGNGFTLKGSNMDHAESMNNSCVKNIFQETKGGVNYIDIETEFAKLEKLSKGLSKVERTDDETVCDFSDFNNRKVMLDMKKPYMVFDVNAYELSSNTPITLVDYVEQGPESVIINVDLKDYSGSSFDENAHIKYLTVNGESIANKERTTWEYGKVLWNFYDSSEADGCYNGTIKVNGNFLGSILAPGAAVITNQNFDGTAICRTFENHAETHRNDFTGNLPKIDLDSDFDSKTTVATTESSTEATTVATTEMVTSTDTTTTEATTAEETTDKTTEATTAEETTDKTTEATTAEETTDKTTEATTVEKTTATTTEATTSSTTEVITVEELSTETTSKTAIDDDDSHKQTTTEATSETTTEATSETTTFEEDTTKADSDESTTKADDKEESSESTTSEDTAESSETTSEQTEDTESSESTTEEESTNKEEDTSVEDTTTSGSAIDDDDIDKKTTSESTTESTTETTTQNVTESESESSTETTTDSVNETATEATTKNATDDSDGDKETTTKGGQSSSDSDRDDNDSKGDSASESTTETFSEGSTETTTTNGGDSSSDSERPGGSGAAGDGNTESTTSDSDNATETTTTDGDSSTNGHRGGGSSSNKASVTSDEKVEDNTNVDETEDVTDGTSEVEEITEANTEESFDTTVSSNDVTDTDNTTDNSDDVNSIIDNADNNGSVSDNVAAAAAAATAASNSNADKLPQTGSVINTVALFAAGFGAIALGMFLVLKSRKKA